MAILEGKTAVVTGSTRGIGLAIALQFAKEGAKVMINHRRVENPDIQPEVEAFRAFHDARLPLPVLQEADLTKEKEVTQLAETALRKLGGLDIWVNNVGSHLVTPALEQSQENWETLFGVNSTSTFLGCREAARVMKQKGGGSIINISSKMGLVGSPENACYCAAKAAVVMMTRCLAAEWAGYQIRVNAIAPGVTWTGPTYKVVEGKPELEAALHYRTPMQRFAEPHEIANVAIFLASEASSYVTGETIACDGGWLANSDFAGIPPHLTEKWRKEFPRKRN